MNESTITTPPINSDKLDQDDAPTALAQLLSDQGRTSNLPGLTYVDPARREEPTNEDVSQQLLALLQGAGAFDLGSMAHIAVTGPDRVRWLNGMVTNSVHSLEEGRGNYNFILNVQGRIQGDAYIYRQGERLLIETSRSQTRKLLDHLDHFIIMDDVELKPLANLTALGVAGPGASALLGKLGVEHVGLEPLTLTQIEIAGADAILIHGYEVVSPRYELWFEQQHAGAVWQALLEAGATACGATAVEALRILEGIPAYGVDIRDRDLAQETGQARALNFSKGCYLGQEIVERIRSRGNVHRIFARLELTGRLPEVPAELRLEGKAVGQITSASIVPAPGNSRILALGFIRTEVLAANASIEYDGGVARALQNATASGRD